MRYRDSAIAMCMFNQFELHLYGFDISDEITISSLMDENLHTEATIARAILAGKNEAASDLLHVLDHRMLSDETIGLLRQSIGKLDEVWTCNRCGKPVDSKVMRICDECINKAELEPKQKKELPIEEILTKHTLILENISTILNTLLNSVENLVEDRKSEK